MGTWVAVIAATKGRADFWDATRKLGVRGLRPVKPYVLIDCGSAFDRVRDVGRDLSRELGIETIALAAQTAVDVHCIWVHRAGELVRELVYNRDEGGWLTWEGTPQPWEATYFFGDDDDPELEDEDRERYERARRAGDAGSVRDLLRLSSTMNLVRVCQQLGIDGVNDGEWKPPRKGLFARLFS